MVTETEIVGAVAACVGILLTFSEADAEKAIAEVYAFAGDKEPLRAFAQIVEEVYHRRRA